MLRLRLILSSLLVLSLAGCQESDFLVCVQYRASWCSVCKAQESGFERWGAAKEIETAILDITAQPRTRIALEITQYPTYILYNNGVEISRANHYSNIRIP